MKKPFFLPVLFLLFARMASADSPITSTSFYSSYNELPQIYKAEETGVLNYEFASFLSSTIVTIDKKVALINALGWSVDGKNNKVLFEKFLKTKYKVSYLDYTKITSDEQLCLGYLAIMDDYFQVREPLQIIKAALRRNPKSYTYNIIYGLVLGQMMLELGNYSRGFELSDSTIGEDLYDYRYLDTTSTSWCNIYQILAKIEANKTLIQDFRISAKRNVFSYVNEYRDVCKPEDLILIPSTSHLNELTDNRIKLTRKGGVYKIPVQLNEALTIDFIFDSGASDVTLSNDVFTTLVKQGKIEENDILGYEYYQIADGSTVKHLSIMLRKLQIGQIVVNNVKASVGTSSTPLLLGQSFMQKFKQFTIDNENGILLIDPNYARMY